MQEYILKIVCNDEKGLVYKISSLIFKNDINIIKNDEFVIDDKFFFRAVLNGEFDKNTFLDTLKKELNLLEISLELKRKKDIVIFVTKESHCLGDLLIKHYSNELYANIKAIISNHEILNDLVSKFNIPFHCIKIDDLTREEHEKKIIKCIGNYKFDYIVLAKYMRVLTPYFVEHFQNKIINIHHSFLPAFIGANPYKQAYERGVKIIGATAHFVNNDLDEGPIITQDVLSVNHEHTWQQMQKAGKNIEKNVLSKALDLVFDDKIFLHKNKTIIF